MCRMNGLCVAGVLVLCALLLTNEVMCQDEAIPPAATGAPAAGNGTSGPTATPDSRSSSAADSAHSAAPVLNSHLTIVANTTNLTAVEDLSSQNNMETKSHSQRNETDSSSKGSSVFVGTLVTGLLVAVGLTVGYLNFQRRPSPKGEKLAEEGTPMDQQNQGNTLASDAPLNPPPENQEKPSVNGETPEPDKTQPPPTNGHSTANTADAEL